jgi:ABC-type branched-subunit amino acid transport system substrate-binding protein
MNRPKRQKLAAGAALCALAIVATACSSSNSSTSSSSSTSSTASGSNSSTATTAAAPTGSAINIGVIEPTNTSIYNAGDEVAAVRAAAAGINGQGGINGHKVVVDYCNSQDDPNATAACVRQMISDKVVELAAGIDILGPSMVESLSAAGIPVVDEDALSLGEMTATTAFPLTGGIPAAEAVEAYVAAQKGFKKILLVANSGSPFETTFETALSDSARKNGIAYAGVVDFPVAGVSDFSPDAAKIVNSGADIVSIPLSIDQAIPLIQAVRALGSKVQFIINSGAFTNAAIAQNSALVNGLYIVNDVPPVTASTESQFPVIKTFVSQMNAEAATGDSNANLNDIRSFALRIWDVLQAQFQIMKGIGGAITASSFLAALDSAKDVSLDGILPDWTPSAHISITGLGSTRYSEANYWLLKIEGGQQKLLSSQPINAAAVQGQ